MKILTANSSSLGQLKNTTKPRLWLWALVLLVPLLVINLVSFVGPITHLVQLSFLQSRAGVISGTYSLENYANFFSDGYYWGLIGNSLMMSFTVTLITLGCSYPIALFLYRMSASSWRNVLFVLTISPLLVSSVVRTYGWMVLLGDQGVLNSALLGAGLLDHPLRLVNNRIGVAIGLVETLVPYMVLSLMAGFGRLDLSLEEAAASLGANRIKRFFRIILPLTVPGIALGCLLCFVLAISSFITPKLLGGGRVFLLATEIYDQAVIQLEWSMAATLSIIVLLIFALTLFLYSQFARRFG
ncbi:ABC transporter permease [Halotalea alkalilenta]|uniref:ABC transporter permease n=1 Tax=Halotalea alkalilenta TaxID=376489 RepID=UPI0012DE0968|nr:ABC transporter permease [Halotalea alkalilenta]